MELGLSGNLLGSDRFGGLAEHTRLVGAVAIGWSRLHETLALVFNSFFAAPGMSLLALAAWHSVKSDRGQRDMLYAVAKASCGGTGEFYDCLKWGLDQLSGNIEDSRNDAIHAPYTFSFEDGFLSMIPDTSLGNVRAGKLKNKDLVVELKSYETRIRLLQEFFLESLIAHLGKKPLPDRPKLPRPAHSQTQKARNPNKRGKGLQRQP